MNHFMRASTLIVLVAMPALSQVEITKGSYVGVGFSAFKSGFGEGFLVRPATGLFVKGEIVDGLGIRPDISYESRGEASSRNAVVLEYINVGLFLDYTYTIVDRAALSVHAMAGPVWSPLLQAEFQHISGPTKLATDVRPYTSSDDFGWMLGAGVGIGVGNGNLVLDARLYLGTQALTIYGFGYPMLNRSVVITAGFEF